MNASRAGSTRTRRSPALDLYLHHPANSPTSEWASIALASAALVGIRRRTEEAREGGDIVDIKRRQGSSPLLARVRYILSTLWQRGRLDSTRRTATSHRQTKGGQRVSERGEGTSVTRRSPTLDLYHRRLRSAGGSRSSTRTRRAAPRSLNRGRRDGRRLRRLRRRRCKQSSSPLSPALDISPQHSKLGRRMTRAGKLDERRNLPLFLASQQHPHRPEYRS